MEEQKTTVNGAENGNDTCNTEVKKPFKPTPKTPAQKKREREDFKRRYFDYYDDVKTNIKQDW
ncbi:MAG: hypothetical protein E7339_00745 [Clostridiales bacterium]|nr:hypothetical protein [Clostridiales bacterium]